MAELPLRRAFETDDPVLRVVLERAAAGGRQGVRRDEHVVCLAVEGGAMRGSVSAGMCAALEALGRAVFIPFVGCADDRVASPSWFSDRGEETMAIGPVQLIVLGFEHPEFHGEIRAELERLKQSDTVRVIDALAVHKDAVGEIEVVHLSNLSKDEAIELGSKVGALVGLGIEGEEGIDTGAEMGAAAAADGVNVFSDEDAWDVIEEIPNDSAAALILLEHHWAVPLRDAIARAGGSRISDGFISPLDLVEIGLLSREEAQELHAAESAGQTA